MRIATERSETAYAENQECTYGLSDCLEIRQKQLKAIDRQSGPSSQIQMYLACSKPEPGTMCGWLNGSAPAE